jgi:hypothetical protein
MQLFLSNGHLQHFRLGLSTLRSYLVIAMAVWQFWIIMKRPLRVSSSSIRTEKKTNISQWNPKTENQTKELSFLESGAAMKTFGGEKCTYCMYNCSFTNTTAGCTVCIEGLE